jgi:membrane protein YdbS with pleckstrin-like domain
MNDYLHYISIPLIILVIGIFFKNRKSDTQSNVIRQPKMYFYGGIFMAIIGSLLALLVGLFSTPENETETLVGILVLLGFAMIGVALIYWSFNWKIEITEDDLVFRSGFKKKKTFRIKDLAYDSNNSKSDLYIGDQLVLSVTVMMENYDLISKTIKLIAYNSSSTGTIKGNSNARNFGFTFSILGLIFSLLFIITLHFNESSTDIVISYVLLVVGLIMLVFGVFLILLRYVWKITIDEERVEIISIFGFKKTYHKKDLKYQVTNHGNKVFLKDNQIIYFNENFTEQPKLIYSLVRKK